MDETAKTSPLSSAKWVGLIVAAVILAEGIWGILVSLTRSLLLPLLARVMGADPQSPLYLGKGDLNIPDLFGAIVQLCLAGIVFLLIRSWAGKGDRVRTSRPQKIAQQAKTVQTRPIPALSISPETVAPAAAAQAATAVASPNLPPVQPQVPVPVARAEVAPTSPPPATKPAKDEKPAKPEKPREVYYNIVGEPINPTEDD